MRRMPTLVASIPTTPMAVSTLADALLALTSAAYVLDDAPLRRIL